MGISRFYRWLSERYPLINETVTYQQIPPFDNFYLDLNGVVHHCAHGGNNDTSTSYSPSDDTLWVKLFQYISTLVQCIRPRKLLYLAVDGVAPRAKMNQQRSRRFRSAQDRLELIRERQAAARGGRLLTKPEILEEASHRTVFDVNSITPGTAFMQDLVKHLDYFVHMKIQTDPLWQNIEVILSGPDVGGEGEHKIMDFIRKTKSQPTHDPRTRHCLYGLDADLIMLGLASHEPHFSLFREEIKFGTGIATDRPEDRVLCKSMKYQLLHLSVLREYLQLDFSRALFDDRTSDGGGGEKSRTVKPTKAAGRKGKKRKNEGSGVGTSLPLTDPESLLPDLKNMHITSPRSPPHEHGLLSGKNRVMIADQDDISSGSNGSESEGEGEYTTTTTFSGGAGSLIGNTEIWDIERLIDDLILVCFLAGNDFLPHLPFTEIGRGGMNRMFRLYHTYVCRCATKQNSRPCSSEDAGNGQSNWWLTSDCGTIQWENLEKFLRIMGEAELEDLEEKINDVLYMKGKQQSSRSRGGGRGGRHVTEESGASSSADDEAGSCAWITAWDEKAPPRTIDEALEQYYRRKMDFGNTTSMTVQPTMGGAGVLPKDNENDHTVGLPTSSYELDIKAMCENYLAGLQWNLWYYYRGVPSWSWYYKCHYPPYVLSLLQYGNVKEMNPKFELGRQFSPFEQLMAVLPAPSSDLLPQPYRPLMSDPASPILDFYPPTFGVDTEGTDVPWQGVALLPFIDERRLLAAMRNVEMTVKLPPREKRRNYPGRAFVFRYDPENTPPYDVASSLPRRFRPINACRVSKIFYEHPQLPPDVPFFKAYALPGSTPILPEFPSLLRGFSISEVWLDRGLVVHGTSSARHPGCHLQFETPLVNKSVLDQVLRALPDAASILSQPGGSEGAGPSSGSTSGQSTPPPGLMTSPAASNAPALGQSIMSFRDLFLSPIVTIDFPCRRVARVVGCVIRDKYFRVVHPPPSPAITGGHMPAPPSPTGYLTPAPPPAPIPPDLSSLLAKEELLGIHWDAAHETKRLMALCLADALRGHESPLGGSPVSKHKKRRNKGGVGSLLSSQSRQILAELRDATMADLFLEVVMAEEKLCGSDRRVYFRFGFRSTYRPALLVLAGSQMAAELLPPPVVSTSPVPIRAGMEVVCLDPKSILHGCVGEVQSPSEQSPMDSTRCAFPLSLLEPAAVFHLQESALEVAKRDEERLKWFSLEQIIRMVNLRREALSRLTRSVLVSFGKARHDIGMNLTTSPGGGGGSGVEGGRERIPLCLPTYTKFIRTKDPTSRLKPLYSNLGIALIKNYIETWPTVVRALESDAEAAEEANGEEGRSRGGGISMSTLFPRSANPASDMTALLDWCKKQPFYRLNLASYQGEALTIHGIRQMESSQDQILTNVKRLRRTAITFGLQHMWPVEARNALPDEALAASSSLFHATLDSRHRGSLELGQRVVYGACHGLVPLGARGVVVGTSADVSTGEQLVEVVMDDPHLSCTDLGGRCSPNRGLIVSAAHLLVPLPVVRSWGLDPSSAMDFKRLVSFSLTSIEFNPKEEKEEQPPTLLIKSKNKAMVSPIVKTNFVPTPAYHRPPPQIHAPSAPPHLPNFPAQQHPPHVSHQRTIILQASATTPVPPPPPIMGQRLGAIKIMKRQTTENKPRRATPDPQVQQKRNEEHARRVGQPRTPPLPPPPPTQPVQTMPQAAAPVPTPALPYMPPPLGAMPPLLDQQVALNSILRDFHQRSGGPEPPPPPTANPVYSEAIPQRPVHPSLFHDPAILSASGSRHHPLPPPPPGTFFPPSFQAPSNRAPLHPEPHHRPPLQPIPPMTGPPPALMASAVSALMKQARVEEEATAVQVVTSPHSARGAAARGPLGRAHRPRQQRPLPRHH